MASITGIGGMVGSIDGILFPWVAGRLLDTVSAMAGYAILLAICASAYRIAFAIHHTLAPKFVPFLASETTASDA